MKNIAIIPARGGSKRIPRKNIKLFHGKPIISYAIESALSSGLFDEVIVSTDDLEIAEIALKHGAKVPFYRSTENSDDFATTSSVLLEVILELEKESHTIDSICCIYPTSPLIGSQDLIAAEHRFKNEKFDTLISCVCYSFPIQRAFEMTETNEVQLLHPELINQRSQDLNKTYHDAGSFYFFKNNAFKKNKSLWIGNIGAYELPETKVQDIDTNEDWLLAELKFSSLK